MQNFADRALIIAKFHELGREKFATCEFFQIRTGQQKMLFQFAGAGLVPLLTSLIYSFDGHFVIGAERRNVREI